jgi:hypothetical protein
MNITNKIDHWMNLLPLNSTNYSPIDLYFKLIQNNIINSKCLIECPEECDSISYDAFHSFSKLENYKNIQLNDCVYFTIFYESLSYTVIDQVPKMNILDLISNIGGNLGLFIGVSFLSFAEIIELFIEILFILKS